MRKFRKFAAVFLCLLMALTLAAPVRAEGAGNQAITAGTPFRVTVKGNNQGIFLFTPTESGIYCLTVGDVYKGDGQFFHYGIDEDPFYWILLGDEYAHEIYGYFQAGTTYQLRIISGSGGELEFDLTVDKRPFEVLSLQTPDQVAYQFNNYHWTGYNYYPETDSWDCPENDSFYLETDKFIIQTADFTGSVDEFMEAYKYRFYITYSTDHGDGSAVGTYQVTVTLSGLTSTYQLQVRPSPIESVSFDPVILFEGAFQGEPVQHGYTDENGNQVLADLIEYSAIYPDNITVVADGKTYHGQPYAVAEELNNVYGFFPSIFMFPRASELVSGDNTVLWSFDGLQIEGIVRVKPNPVISISKPADISLYKDDYSVMTLFGETVRYYEYFPEQITVNTIDGQISGTYFEVDNRLNDKYGLSLELWPDVEQYDTPWGAGETHNIYVMVGSVSSEYKVKILNKAYILSASIADTTVEESELLYENIIEYNPETGLYEVVGIAEFYVPVINSMTVKTQDGTFKGTEREVYQKLAKKMRNYFVDLTAAREDQIANGTWELGSTHDVTFRIGEVTGTFKTTVTKDTRPYFFSVEQSTDGISLTWTEFEGADKYILYRRTFSGDWEHYNDGEYGEWEKIKTVAGTAYTDGGVKNTMGTIYSYRVRAHKADGSYSNYSRELELDFSPFTDVEYGTRDYEHVRWAYNNGIVNGLSNDHTRFGLEGRCTRAQFCIMLWKMAGKPDVTGMECPFTDLSGVTDNNRKAIIWCYNQKIVNGTSPTTFAPSGDITRAQLAIMVWKMAGQPKVTGMSCPYEDLGSLSANNQKAVIWCYNKGLIDSLTGTSFSPKTKGTRALLTEMLYGYNLLQN